jgi:hypothetical protein
LVEQDDGELRALTATGAFHIEKLHLNRQQLVVYRRERRLLAAARQQHARLLERLQQLEDQVQTLTDRLEQLDRGKSNS